MSHVRIPPVLRTATGGQKQVDVGGATVGAVVTALVGAYPGLAAQLLTPEGELNRFVNVFLNDTDVRHLQALETPIGERDTLVLLPAMAGGADASPAAGEGAATDRCRGMYGGPCSCPGRASTD